VINHPGPALFAEISASLSGEITVEGVSHTLRTDVLLTMCGHISDEPDWTPMMPMNTAVLDNAKKAEVQVTMTALRRELSTEGKSIKSPTNHKAGNHYLSRSQEPYSEAIASLQATVTNLRQMGSCYRDATVSPVLPRRNIIA
jgi:hypothetical protein